MLSHDFCRGWWSYNQSVAMVQPGKDWQSINSHLGVCSVTHSFIHALNPISCGITPHTVSWSHLENIHVPPLCLTSSNFDRLCKHPIDKYVVTLWLFVSWSFSNMCSMLKFYNCFLIFLGYKCTEEGCNEEFTKWSLLRKHVAEDHISGMCVAVRVIIPK